MPPAATRAALVFSLALVAACPAAAQPVDLFEPDVQSFEWSGSYLPEIWNENLATDRLVGVIFTAGRSWAPGWQGLTEFALGRAMLGGEPDALYVGVTGGVRRRIARHGRATFYLDALVGFALANRHVPKRGTSFNWVAQGGGGWLWRLGTQTYAVTGVRVYHLSNGGMQGNHRNPDIEAIGGYAGLGFGF